MVQTQTLRLHTWSLPVFPFSLHAYAVCHRQLATMGFSRDALPSPATDVLPNMSMLPMLVSLFCHLASIDATSCSRQSIRPVWSGVRMTRRWASRTLTQVRSTQLQDTRWGTEASRSLSTTVEW